MFHKRSFWITAVIFLIIAGGGFFYYNNQTAVVDAAEQGQDVQTAVVRRGNIAISATGAGAVIPSVEVAIGFPSSGILTNMNVQVGDMVQAGDVLAQMDDTDARQAVTSAELQLAQAAMRVNGETTQTGTSYDDISVELAQISLENAQTALNDLLDWEPDSDEIARLEAQQEAAQASYSAAQGQTAASASGLTVNRINLEQAQRDLEEAQAAYDTAYDPGREWELNDPRTAARFENERAAAERNLQKAEDNLTIAQANYNSAISGQNNSSVISAEANLLNAQQALAEAQTGPTTDAIAAAETAVRQAQLSLYQVQLNQEADLLSLEQTQLTLQSAQERLTETDLVSPIDGTVLAVAGSVGEMVGTGAIITLADLEQPVLEVFIDETDLDKMGIGFEAEVIFDAFPDETYTGIVIQVDPELSTISGVTAVRALVQLDNFAKPQNLPVGLNATVDIIGGRADNALLVPVEAIREINSGQFALFVMENGEPNLRLVEVGLMDFTYAEILTGVAEGDVVTTGIVETE